MTTLTENPRTGEFIVSEAPGLRSREQITAKSGAGVLKAGTVIAAVITAATVASAAKAGGNTGNGTSTPDVTLAALPGAQIGIYKLRCVAAAANNGTFQLTDPNGKSLGHFVMAGGTVTTDNQIKVAIADGATDFVVGDGFDITVSAVTRKYVQLAPARRSRPACSTRASTRRRPTCARSRSSAPPSSTATS
jgi:hypothetical protein